MAMEDCSIQRHVYYPFCEIVSMFRVVELILVFLLYVQQCNGYVYVDTCGCMYVYISVCRC